MATVRLLRSTTPGNTPSSLVPGQLAINEADGKLFYRAASGAVALLPTVYEYATTANFPATGNAAQLVLATDTGRVYRWMGTAYVELGSVGGGVIDQRWDLFLPPAPTGVSAAVGNAQATVSWTAPTVSSQTPITDYLVQFQPSGGSWQPFSDSVSTATSAVVTGLTNGTAYQFRVAAVNAVGTGSYSTASSAVTPVSGDPYFSYVALLLHADGTESTFVDSSSTPKMITAVNATQSDAQSKWGGKSLLIDSPSKYLSLPSAGFTMAGDFVMECWVYMTGSASSYVLIEGRTNYNDYQDFVWYLNGGGYNGLVVAPAYARLDGTTALVPQNQWAHIAVVRSSGVISAYVNGVRDATTVSYSGAITPAASALRIGSNGANAFSGYIDDMRITVGSNRNYTGATIQVPTAAFPDA